MGFFNSIINWFLRITQPIRKFFIRQEQPTLSQNPQLIKAVEERNATRVQELNEKRC